MSREDLLAVYVFSRMPGVFAGEPVVQRAVLVLRAPQLVALVVLTSVTVG